MRRFLLLALVLVALVSVGCNPGDDEGGAFDLSLSGDAEICDGDTCGGSGSGDAEVEINTDENQICYEVSLSGVSDVAAAHIHEGVEGEAGDVVVDLEYDGDDEGADACVDGVDEGVLEGITEEPSGFYLNVHSAEYPDGAVRGQLGD